MFVLGLGVFNKLVGDFLICYIVGYIYIRYPPRHVFNGFCGICTLPTQVWICLSQVWTCPSEALAVHLSGSKIQDFLGVLAQES